MRLRPAAVRVFDRAMARVLLHVRKWPIARPAATPAPSKAAAEARSWTRNFLYSMRISCRSRSIWMVIRSSLSWRSSSSRSFIYPRNIASRGPREKSPGKPADARNASQARGGPPDPFPAILANGHCPQSTPVEPAGRPGDRRIARRRPGADVAGRRRLGVALGCGRRRRGGRRGLEPELLLEITPTRLVPPVGPGEPHRGAGIDQTVERFISRPQEPPFGARLKAAP